MNLLRGEAVGALNIQYCSHKHAPHERLWLQLRYMAHDSLGDSGPWTFPNRLSHLVRDLRRQWKGLSHFPASLPRFAEVAWENFWNQRSGAHEPSE